MSDHYSTHTPEECGYSCYRHNHLPKPAPVAPSQSVEEERTELDAALDLLRLDLDQDDREEIIATAVDALIDAVRDEVAARYSDLVAASTKLSEAVHRLSERDACEPGHPHDSMMHVWTNINDPLIAIDHAIAALDTPANRGE